MRQGQEEGFILWTTACQSSFDDMKKAFISAPVLIHADPNKPYYLETDSSDFAHGAVLSQKADDGCLHPIAFMSKSLSPAERNYDIYDREMLTICEALKDWRHFLEGLPQPFEIWTDHQNLQFWQTAQNLSRRQAR